MTNSSAFWDDHNRDLDDPEYRAEFARASAEISVTDAKVNEELRALRNEFIAEASAELNGFTDEEIADALAETRRHA